MKNLYVLVNIGIFRRPEEKGFLNGIPTMVAIREQLLDFVENSISFIPKTNDDFGYTISDESKCHVTDIVRKSKDTIILQLKGISEDYLNFYKNLERTTMNWIFIFGKYQEGYNAVHEIQQKAEAWNINELINTIIDNTDKLGIHLNNDFLQNIKSKIEFLNFLDTITNNATLNVNELMYVFNTTLREFESIIYWYEYIHDMYMKLMEYEIQILTRKYLNEVDEILQMISLRDTKSISKLETFLIEKLKIPMIPYGNELEFEDVRMNQIEFILQLTLKHKIPKECFSNKSDVCITNISENLEEIKSNNSNFIIPIVEIILIHKIFLNLEHFTQSTIENIEMNDIIDVGSIYDQCRQMRDSLLSLKDKINSAGDLNDLLDALRNISITMNLTLIELENLPLSEFSKYIKSWNNTVNFVIAFCTRSLNWYQSLIEVYSELTSSTVQNNISKYPQDIKNFKHRMETENMSIMEYVEFLNKIQIINTNLDRTFDEDHHKKKHLNQVIKKSNY